MLLLRILTLICVQYIKCKITHASNLNNLNVNTIVGGTNLTTGTYYCIREKGNGYLKWDGNRNEDSYGLIIEDSDDCTSSDSFLFHIVVEENEIKIQNKGTNASICMVSNTYFRLGSSKTKDTKPIRIVLKTDGYINLISTYVSTYSYYITTKVNYYNDVGTYGLITGSNAANWSFIPAKKQDQPNDQNYLTLRISQFNYIIPDQDYIRDHINRIELFPPTIVNNSSPADIEYEILNNDEDINESLIWEFQQSFDNFNDVIVIKNLPQVLNKNARFKKIPKSFNFKTSNSFDNNLKAFEFKRHYNIKRTVEIPSNNGLKLEAYVDIVEDLNISFRAKGVISGSGDLSGTQIANIISGNFTIIDVKNNSVVIEVNGILNANFGLDYYFNVINTDVMDINENIET